MHIPAPFFTSNGLVSCQVPADVLGYINSIKTCPSSVLETPSARRKHGAVPPNFTPRRRCRLAKSDRGLDSETKAKRVLLRRLGLLGDDEPISEEALARYNKLFARPLAVDIVLAFADFFGWIIPTGLLDGVATAAPRLVEV